MFGGTDARARRRSPRLPGGRQQLALTVDDGVSSAVVAAFGQFCRDTGPLTFFVNGVNPSWSDNAAAAAADGGLRPDSDGTHLVTPVPQRISLTAVGTRSSATPTSCATPYGGDGTPFFPSALRVHNAGTESSGADLGYNHRHALER